MAGKLGKLGKLIVLEGIDGSSKSTQFNRICEHLKADGQDFMQVKFPRYGCESAALIRRYLAGEYGSDPAAVNAYAASVMYAMDRYDSFMSDWRDYYAAGGLVMLDRYTTSNACHQGSKLPEGERGEFLDWLYHFEFTLLGLPRPNAVIYLNTDITVSRRAMAGRQNATGEKADIHEKNIEYLTASLNAGRYAAKHLGWTVVESVENGEMRSIEDIHAQIYSCVKEILQA